MGAGQYSIAESRARILEDILLQLDFLERQADRAGFTEVGDLISIARLAGRDAKQIIRHPQIALDH